MIKIIQEFISALAIHLLLTICFFYSIGMHDLIKLMVYYSDKCRNIYVVHADHESKEIVLFSVNQLGSLNINFYYIMQCIFIIMESSAILTLRVLDLFEIWQGVHAEGLEMDSTELRRWIQPPPTCNAEVINMTLSNYWPRLDIYHLNYS